MRPTPIDAELIPPGSRRVVVAPPSGDLTDEHIAPVEALRSDRDGTWTMRLVLEDGELEKLQRGAAVFLFIQATHLVPFAVEVIE